MNKDDLSKLKLKFSHRYLRTKESFFKYASSKLNYSRTIPNLKDGNTTIRQNCKKEKNI